MIKPTCSRKLTLVSKTLNPFTLVKGGLIIGTSLYLIINKKKFKFNFKIIATIAALESIQAILYIIGLKIGVVTLVAAAHMTVPLWFMLYLTATKKRNFGINEVLSFSLLVGSLIIIALVPSDDKGNVLLGILFGLMAAVFLSLMLNYIFTKGQEEDLTPYIPAKGVLIALFALPAMFIFGDFNTINNQEIIILILAGIFTLSLPIALEWKAIPFLPQSLFSSLILLEIPFTSVWAYLIFSQPFNLIYLLSSLLILVSIFIEIKRVDKPLLTHPAGE